MDASEPIRLIPHAALESLVLLALQEAGVPAEDAAVVADCLLCANLSGFDSHGVVRLAHYLRRLAAGTINPTPRIQFDRPSASVLLVDGDNGLGHVVTAASCRRGSEIARETGVASVSIRNSSHFGMAGYYVLQLVRDGLAAMVTTATDAFLVPHGGTRPFFGTNPLAIGFPAPGTPVVLDMASTSIPWGKLALAEREGRKVPPSWGVDENGLPCEDPARIRGLHPIAGPKGSGLAMVIDVLSNLLAGMAFGPHITRMYGDMGRVRGLGHFLTVWDLCRFVPLPDFVARIGQMIDELTAIPPTGGHERVFYPGEIEGITRTRRREEGIPVEPGLYRELVEIASGCGALLDPWA